MRQHFGTLVGVAEAGLRDSSERVRSQALAAVAALVQWVAEEPEVKAFRALVPSILQVEAPLISTCTVVVLVLKVKALQALVPSILQVKAPLMHACCADAQGQGLPGPYSHPSFCMFQREGICLLHSA